MSGEREEAAPLALRADKEKGAGGVVLLFCLIYLTSYMTRSSFAGVIVEVERATGIGKELLSIALTGTFITYGIGQIISGICGDHFSPKYLLAAGLGISSLMNLLIPFCPNPYWMAVVWCINGFAQSFVWPPLLRLMTELIPSKEYAVYTQRVSWFGNLGRMSVYLLAPLLIYLFSWKVMLFFSGVWGLVMLLFWGKLCPDVRPESRRETAPTSREKGKLFTPLTIGILLAAVTIGIFRDGVQTWMPTFLSETHGLSNITSIFTGVFLPIAGILFVSIVSTLYRKKIKNLILCVGVMFLVGAVTVLIYTLFGANSAVLAVVSTAVLVGSASGANHLITVIQPAFFKKYGNTATAAGVINSAVYVGSAASTYGFAALAQGMGWGSIITAWLMIGGVGVIICLVCSKSWGREYGQ